MPHGQQIFDIYKEAKITHPDIDEWLSQAIALEYNPELVNYIQVGSLCSTTREPWETIRAFEKVVVVLNGRPVFCDVMQDLDIKEIAYAVAVLKAYFPDEMFNDVVSQYIAIEAIEEGFVILPENLEFAQRFLPVTYLDRDQEQIQQLYLDEVAAYTVLLGGKN